jgi:hypothetical protein
MPLARQLRELAQETRQPFARHELLKLSGIYDRRAEHLDSRVDWLGRPPAGSRGWQARL